MTKEKAWTFLQEEILQENCPDIIQQEGKVEVERIHRSPPTFNPQLTTSRNIIAKFKNTRPRKKYYKLLRRSHSDIKELQSE